MLINLEEGIQGCDGNASLLIQPTPDRDLRLSVVVEGRFPLFNKIYCTIERFQAVCWGAGPNCMQYLSAEKVE